MVADRAEALRSCRTALRLEASWENQAALGSILEREPNGRSEARELLDRAEGKVPSEVTVLGAQAQLAYVEQDSERFVGYADRLVKVAPEAPTTSVTMTLAALVRGDADAARTSLERARKAGVEADLVAGLENAIDAHERQ